jgi:hypothetical protein
MTTITICKLDTVVVNGRAIWDTVSFQEITKVSNGTWEGLTEAGDTFSVVGGKASGGARNEWFLYYPLGFGDQYIPATSARKCFEMMGRV